MAVFDLDAKITEEDLSGLNSKIRQPVYLYVEVESEAGAVELRTVLQQFLKNIQDNSVLSASAEVEICVYGKNSNIVLKNCGAVSNTDVPNFSHIQPTCGTAVALAPILELAFSRIAAQKRQYLDNHFSYNQPSLLLFTSGNIADEPWRIQEAVARIRRENSVDILPVCANNENTMLQEISSNGKVLQLPLEQTYTVIFQEICNSMERLSRSTTTAFQELTGCLVDSKDYFK